jgi:hypothetical protein
MVHGLKQIIELNNHAYQVEIAIKEGIIDPVPATVRLTKKQLDELRRLGYEIAGANLLAYLNKAGI